MLPTDPLETHFRLMKDQKTALGRLGVRSILDLLYHFPARYDAPGESGTVARLVHGEKVTLYGTITKIEAKKLWKSRRPAAEGTFEDATGRVRVLWFNQPYMAKMVPQGAMIKLTGTVAGKDKPYITNPEVEALAQSAIPAGLFARTPEAGEGMPSEILRLGQAPRSGIEGGISSPASASLFPVYPETKGISSRWIYHSVRKIFESGVLEQLDDPIPESIRSEYKLPHLADALVYIHTPQKKKDAEAARKRFAFEEIFVIQVGKQQERAANARERAFEVRVDDAAIQKFIGTLPFSLTGAQARAITEIAQDFQKPHPMARLLEGDVGSGKTAVAAATSYAVVTSRPANRNSGTLQVAYMAPTEILAQQHFQSFIEYFKELPINLGLLTGSGCYKFPSKLDREKPTKISRSQLLKWVAHGEIAMLIGTHALIQKSVHFKHLAYVIVDEQHRFGTRQRKTLAHKGDALPHFLSMTATPIPRTLALTIYGDLDVSVLDELPKNRAGLATKIVAKEKRAEAYTYVQARLAEGRQAYVICPRIEEPDPEKEFALRVKSAMAEAKRLQTDIFPQARVGLLHGKLTPQKKDEVMKDFSEGRIDILVATSVVEVGVNVPNATTILIEGAERFGLAQLHQLRGRVLRSAHEAACFLLSDSASAGKNERLKALEKTRSGFELAEYDLQIRGAGDLQGRVQWGVSDIGMEALKNPRLIEAARTAAQKLVAKDPTLGQHKTLLSRVEKSARDVHHE